MEALRQFRKAVTFGALRVGMEAARQTAGVEVIETLRAAGLGLTRVLLPLRRRLRTNMKLAGVWRPGLEDEHFARALDQMAMLAHVFRAGFAASGCGERFRFDGSLGRLRQAYEAGRGVIHIAPHLCGYPLYPPAVTPHVPCSIYLRRNTDPRKMRINEAIGRAGDGHLVAPPPGATKAQRLQVALDVLRAGRVLYITPDTPRKPRDGVAVTVLGRTTHFPTGVFVMSLRTGAPVVPAWWHWDDGAYHVRCGEPISLTRGRRLRQQAEDAMQAWAADVDAFLRAHPAMWWNWLDKRWTRIVRGV